MHGIVLLDKPAGYSSSQAVQKVRWLFQARKAGHTGSLDPFATGMLPICLGEASKTAGFMLDAHEDLPWREPGWGRPPPPVISRERYRLPRRYRIWTVDQVKMILAGFEGPISQVPPMYSALKHQGQPLYRLARAGLEVPRQPREVTIHALDLISWEPPILEFRVRCSKGTYVRTLAEDIAQAMGSCAHLQALRRLEVGPFQETGMLTLEELEAMAGDGTGSSAACWRRTPDCRTGPSCVSMIAARRAFGHGNPVAGVAGEVAGPVRVYGPGDVLLGLGELTADRSLKARRVMHLETTLIRINSLFNIGPQFRMHG